MIVNSLRCYVPRTVHDHGSVARRAARGRGLPREDGVAPLGELAANLEADAAIAAGNQRNHAHIVDCLHDM